MQTQRHKDRHDRQTKTDTETDKRGKKISDPSPIPFIETQGLAYIHFCVDIVLLVNMSIGNLRRTDNRTHQQLRWNVQGPGR